MSLFVVVVNTEDQVRKTAGESGKVVDVKGTGDQAAIVVKFDDERAGRQFSLELNGTVFGVEWAARENARHRATASV